MSALSLTLLVFILYVVYKVNSAHSQVSHGSEFEVQESGSSLTEMVRHIRNMDDTKVQYCGSRLPKVVRMVCNNNIFAMQGKRSFHHKDGFEPFERFRRSITQECCINACSKSTLLKYCNHTSGSGARASIATPAPTPRPTQNERAPDVDSPEGNTDETNIVPEETPQTVEQIQERSPAVRGRHRLSEDNIIRDEDDDSMSFSVGLKK